MPKFPVEHSIEGAEQPYRERFVLISGITSVASLFCPEEPTDCGLFGVENSEVFVGLGPNMRSITVVLFLLYSRDFARNR